jgi:hypothetical protein
MAKALEVSVDAADQIARVAVAAVGVALPDLYS